LNFSRVVVGVAARIAASAAHRGSGGAVGNKRQLVGLAIVICELKDDGFCQESFKMSGCFTLLFGLRQI